MKTQNVYCRESCRLSEAREGLGIEIKIPHRYCTGIVTPLKIDLSGMVSSVSSV
jgi:hypothetical protein